MTFAWWHVGVAAAALWLFGSKEARAMLGGSSARLSQKGVDFIFDMEGTKIKNGLHVPYNDAAGLCTIGIGHLMQPKGPCNSSHKPITDAEARALFDEDQLKFVNGITRLVRVPLAQHELDALFSFVFNIGLGGFGSSTLLRKLNAGDRASVPLEMARWNKETRNGTLVVSPTAGARRRREGQLFAAGIYELRSGKLL